MEEIKIILPGDLYFIKSMPGRTYGKDVEEYNLYFENMIFPYRESLDVLVECDYGVNLGRCWRLSMFSEDVSEFPLTVRVYNEYGQLLAEKSSTVHLIDRKKHNDFVKVMCVGDSMTRAQVYMEHILHKLHKVKFIGTRNIDGIIGHEGRGGWSFKSYFNDIDKSPFLFPKGIDFRKYAGGYDYIEKTLVDNIGDYEYDGLQSKPIGENDFFIKDGKLYERRDGGDELIDDTPEFEFSFKKYMEKNALEKPDIVSILLGANDLQVWPYEMAEEKIKGFIENYKKFIKSIREYDKDIPVVINLPVMSGEDYDWGNRGLKVSAKTYNYKIKNAAYELLGLAEKNVYISPMLLTLDIENGFDKLGYRANAYSETVEVHQSNWVHPNHSGYCQMGDALAPFVEMIRKR